MGWGFDDIGDVFDGIGKLTMGAMTGGLSLVADAVKPTAPPTPVNPETDPAAIEARNKVAREEQLRRLLGGRESTIQTGPLGLSSDAAVATKSLLGS